MNDVPEFLEREFDLALGQRVDGGIDLADLKHAADLELDVLLGPLGRLLDLALDEHGGPGGGEARERVHGGVNDDLKRGGAGAVAELQEGEGALPLLPARPDPPPDHDAVPGTRGACGKDITDAGARGGGLKVVAEGSRGHRRRGGVGSHGDREGMGVLWAAAAGTGELEGVRWGFLGFGLA